MTVSRFVPGARPVAWQQLPQGHGQTLLPPSLPSGQTWKRQRTFEQTPYRLG